MSTQSHPDEALSEARVDHWRSTESALNDIASQRWGRRGFILAGEDGDAPEKDSVPFRRLTLPFADPEQENVSLPVFEARHRYVSKKVIGRGGFGLVYLAEVDRNGKASDDFPDRVALKVLMRPPNPENQGVLKRELAPMLSLRHPNIARVLDWSLTGEALFLVFPYYSRGTLADRMEQNEPLSEAECWRLLHDLLHAVHAAHVASILHLDIKPSNVMIADDGRYVLSDFGISQGYADVMYQNAAGLGTRGYQAPEQRLAATEEFDVRTDLWGVGITVWAAATNVDPACRPDLAIAPEAQDGLGIPSIREYRQDFSQEFDSFLMELLRFRSVYRPGCPAELLHSVSTSGIATRAANATPAAAPLEGHELDDFEIDELISSLIDGLWRSILEEKRYRKHFRRFEPGDVICRRGDCSFHALILLKGSVEIRRGEELLATEDREGQFLGEIAALTGEKRTAEMVARNQVTLCVLNTAELENLVTTYPGAGIRLLKTMASRLSRESKSPLADNTD